MLQINEQPIAYEQGITLADIACRILPAADIFIVNGASVDATWPLADGDQCWLWVRGRVPTDQEMRHLLYARHTPGVQDRLQVSSVGIMGLGGLGSSVAIALARMGIGSLLLADFDVVEPTNLNRQQYFTDQIGLKKTEALQETLARINPYVRVETIEERLTEQTIAHHFSGVSALAECFDDPVMKASALRTAMQRLAHVYYVGASGMAGFYDNNEIRTKRLYPKVYLVGDGIHEAAAGEGLMAARVGIAAHHQANQIVRLLLEAESGELKA